MIYNGDNIIRVHHKMLRIRQRIALQRSSDACIPKMYLYHVDGGDFSIKPELSPTYYGVWHFRFLNKMEGFLCTTIIWCNMEILIILAAVTI